jgi:hypothetical protein
MSGFGTSREFAALQDLIAQSTARPIYGIMAGFSDIIP